MPDRAPTAVFAQKFQLALEALNWSRMRCAQEIGIDKSVVSRWASGATVPTEQNLTRLTAKLQQTYPHFQAGAWRLDPDAFAACFQSADTSAPEEPPAAPAVTRGGGPPSIGVLAFDNLSGNPEDEYFADGMAEDLITELSRSRAWLVISRSSSFSFKGRRADIREIGKELGVRYVLEGSIRRASDRVRVTAQLTEVDLRFHVWADRYDRALTDLFAMQDDITLAVSHAIEPALENAERQRVLRKRPDSLDAWEAWQRALSGIDAEDWANVDVWLRRSMELDPGFAAPHGTRAFFLWSSALAGRMPLAETRAEAETESRAAIRLDPHSPAGYAVLSMCLGSVADRVGQAFNAARAVELGPSAWMAQFALLLAYAAAHQFSEAERQLEKVRVISPHGASRRVSLFAAAFLHLLRGEYEQAASGAAALNAAHPDYPHPYWIRLASLGHLGRRDEAAAVLAQWSAHAPGQVAQFPDLGMTLLGPEDGPRLLSGLRAAGWSG